MKDTDRSDHPEHMRRQMREIMSEATLSPAVRGRKLALWAVRQVLLCAVAWYFWEKPWMRWVFAIGIVFALLHLAMIFLLPRLLAAKQRRAEASIDRLADTLANEHKDAAHDDTDADSQRV